MDVNGEMAAWGEYLYWRSREGEDPVERDYLQGGKDEEMRRADEAEEAEEEEIRRREEMVVEEMLMIDEVMREELKENEREEDRSCVLSMSNPTYPLILLIFLPVVLQT